MSDDDGNRSSSGGSFDSVPPELRPYMGKYESPPVQRRGDNPELDAAFDALLALAAGEEKQQIDPTRGIGNAKGYVAPVAVPSSAEKTDAAAEKVEIVVADQPKQLPAGDPALVTEMVNTRAFEKQSKAAKSPSATERATTPMEVSRAAVSAPGSAQSHARARRVAAVALLLMGVPALIGI